MAQAVLADGLVLRRGTRRHAVAAVSIVGPTSHVLGARTVALVQSVRRAAAQVSAALERSQG